MSIQKGIRVVGVPASAFLLLLLGACGGQAGGAPQIVEVFGTVDSPCGIGTPATSLQHCVAHVVLMNTGGEGYGHVTLFVPLKGTTAGSAPVLPATCGASMPDTPPGGYADLTCDFDLAPGQSVVTYPGVATIDYLGASSPATSSGTDLNPIAVAILAVATLLLAAAMVIVASGGRLSVGGTAATPALPETAEPLPSAGPADREPSKRKGADAEYDLPQLPQ